MAPPASLPLLLLLLLSFLMTVTPGLASSGTIYATPHDSYSSSVGVLGCKINTNRVAYWPSSVSCTSLCVSLSYADRQVYLLKIDQSGGAHDVSYDAWNYLLTGKSAAEAPTAGGEVAMEYEDVDAGYCADLITTGDGRLAFSASNSMNFISSCVEEEDSWVAKSYVLYNILDSICTWGYDEECELDLETSNQPTCPHTLGLTDALYTDPVYNILYPSGNTVIAGNGTVVANGTGSTTYQPGGSGAGGGRRLGRMVVVVVGVSFGYPLLEWL